MQGVVFVLVLVAGAVMQAMMPAAAEPRWLRLPPTPDLPHADTSGTVDSDGARIWFAVFGQGDPVILLHGGLANSNYWGLQIPVLARHHQVIVIDSRGHGRSTRTSVPISYDLMASDVLHVMDQRGLSRAALVGWSDGAIIGLDIAIHHPERLTRLFAFAANSDPSGVQDVGHSRVFTEYEARAAREYARLSPTPNQFRQFLANIDRMWASEPHFSEAQLRAIPVPTWIVDGDHDEAIKRTNTDFMARSILGAKEVILPATSHFAFLQDPDGFNAAVMRFLDQR